MCNGEGVEYIKGNNSYLTKNENTVFSVFCELSALCKNKEIKKEPFSNDSFGLVAGTGLEPATSGL